MPELPEVEVCRRQLAAWSEGRAVAGVRLPDPGAVRRVASSRPSDALPGADAVLAGFVGRRCTGVDRHGKRALWRFGDRALLLHLGMTGKWVRRRADEVPRHGRVGVVLDDGSTLWLVDPRRFGCVVPGSLAELSAALGAGHGPDALDAPLDGPGLAARCASGRPIKVVLMEQGRVAGLGNIQAAEALWRAGIAPQLPASALDAAAWARLAEAIPVQLEATLADTLGDEVVYVSEGGDNPFAVYGREGEPCPRCGAAIRKTVLGGRATFDCPVCQPDAVTPAEVSVKPAGFRAS